MADENLNEEQDKESEQFNSMLSAAQKHVGGDGGSGGGLSQAQIEAMLAMSDDDDDDEEEESGSDDGDEEAASSYDDDGNGDATAGDDSEGSDGEDDAAIADKFREGIAADAQAAAEETEKKSKKKKEKKKKEKKPLDKAVLAKIVTALAVVVAAALGFCVSLLMFSDMIKTGNETFAIKAANWVNTKFPINTEFYVYRAYVRNNSSSDECLLYGLTCYEGTEKLDIYRVVIEHDGKGDVNIYYTISEDDPQYLKLKNSEEEKDRIRASQLKNYSDTIYASDKEIQINKPEWEKINCSLINKNITSKQQG